MSVSEYWKIASCNSVYSSSIYKHFKLLAWGRGKERERKKAQKKSTEHLAWQKNRYRTLTAYCGEWFNQEVAIILSLETALQNNKPGFWCWFVAFFLPSRRKKAHAIVPELCWAQRSPDVYCQKLPWKRNASKNFKAVFEASSKIHHNLPLCYTQNMAVLFRD